MKKTDTFFVIDNYNTVPTKILEYTNNYIIYNAKSNEDIEDKLESEGLEFISIPRTGHNISTYFRYFHENYDNLPPIMCLTKGHMLGRHCSEEFFERVYNNKYFTYLYENKNAEYKKNISFLASENQYLEINNSWYVKSIEHPHRYFDNYNRLLLFIYKNPIIPKYCLFAPGGCYIVLKEQILKNSKEFYFNLNKVMSYELNPNFPSEAHQIERMLPIIFEGNYEVNSWMNDTVEFVAKLEEERIITLNNDIENKKISSKLKRKCQSILGVY